MKAYLIAAAIALVMGLVAMALVARSAKLRAIVMGNTAPPLALVAGGKK